MLHIVFVKLDSVLVKFFAIINQILKASNAPDVSCEVFESV